MSKRRDLSALSRFHLGDLQAHPDRMVVIKGGVDIPLEPLWMDILVTLAEEKGGVVSTSQLQLAIWKTDAYGDNPVTKAMSGLRKAIGDDARAPHYIQNLPRRGYRVIAPVSFADDYRRLSNPTDHWSDGNPFVGLAAFDADHAAVFAGRSNATAALLDAIRAQIDNVQRFVLIVGASGCGKTSLLRAGALPMLTSPKGFGGLRSMGVAQCDLAAAPAGDVLLQLASALCDWQLPGGPVFGLQTPESLKARLCETPGDIASMIAEALTRHPQRGLDAEPHAHLLLIIDHAEALTSKTRSPEEQAAFDCAVSALCDASRALVIMVVRNDYYPQLTQALPALTARKAGGHLDLLAPGRGEISDIIRKPAELANLHFEVEESRLDDALRDAAVGQSDALPLLQHTLHALYEQRGTGGALTWEAYRRIGGLEGAIAHHAEQVFSTLPVEAQDSLDAILTKLVVHNPDSEAVTARRVRRDTLTDAANTLVDAFVGGRLFVGTLHDGHPHFGVVHEALLRQWPRAKDWIRENRRLLMAKARLQQAAHRWHEEGGRNDHLLNSGRPLDEAEEVEREMPGDIDSIQRIYLHASRKMRQRATILRHGTALLLIAFSATSLLASLKASESEKEMKRTLDSLVTQADAFRSASEILFQNANAKSAESALTSTMETLRLAHERNPKLEDVLFQYAASSYWLGNFYLRDGNTSKAREMWEIYQRSCKKLIELSPNNPSWEKELSYSYNNMGNLDYRDNAMESALSNFKKSLLLKKKVLASNPLDADLMVELADTLSWIGTVEESLADYQSALTRYREQIRLMQEHSASGSATNDQRRQMGNAMWRYARLLAATGNGKLARTIIKQSTKTLHELAADKSSGDIYKKDHANSLLESSRINRLLGNMAESAHDLKLALETIESIKMGEESPSSWSRLRETIRFDYALHENKSRRWDLIDQSVLRLEELNRRHPRDKQIAIDLASAKIARGHAHESEGRSDKAFADWHSAKAQLEARITPATKDHTLLAPWIAVDELIGQTESARHAKKFLADSGYKTTLH